MIKPENLYPVQRDILNKIVINRNKTIIFGGCRVGKSTIFSVFRAMKYAEMMENAKAWKTNYLSQKRVSFKDGE